MAERTIENLLQEDRTFPPSSDFTSQANAQAGPARGGRRRPRGYWEAQARNRITWFKEPTVLLDDSNPPFFKWFSDGELNVTYNCIDRHIEAGRGDKVAFYWEGEPGDERVLTYQDLYDEVCRFANGLRSIGVKKGDRIAVYMGMVPELAIAMLACARIGAAHSVIFGGFSSDAIYDRVEDAGAEVLITCDGAWRRGGVVDLKVAADRAMERTDLIRHCVVLARTGNEVTMQQGRDIWWHDLVDGQPADCPPEVMNAEDLLYILYTSGTTGKPKGIMHTTGGYLVGATTTHSYVFDVKPDEDIWWCGADIGWVTGHTYIVYGPLANQATSVMYEGTPDYPDKDRLWSIIAKYGVTQLYTAPTAIRAFMKWGVEYPRRHDLSSLRLLGTVGEPINPEAWMWYHEHIGGGHLAGGRHLVADGDRIDHDLAAPGHHHHQTGQRDQAHAGNRGGRGGRERCPGRQGRGRLPGHPQLVAFDAPLHLGRRPALRRHVLVPVREPLLPRRRRQAGRRRLPVAAGTGRRRDAGGGSQHLDDGGRVGPGLPSVGGRGGGGRPQRSAHRAGDRGLREPAGRFRGRQRPDQDAARSCRQLDRTDRQAQEHRLHPRRAEDPLGQDHAPPAQGHLRTAPTGGCDHARQRRYRG